MLIICLIVLFTQSIFPVYQQLEVEGIQVTINGIEFAQGYAISSNVAYIELVQKVELTGDPNDVFSGGFNINMDFGVTDFTFDHLSIKMVNGLEILGHTYIEGEGRHVYSSATGIKTYNGSSIWSAPADGQMILQ